MSEKIVTNILENNHEKKRYLSRKQIATIFEYLISHYDISKYMKEIYFANIYYKKNPDTVAQYDLSTKSILMYEKGLNTYRKIIANDFTYEDKTYKKLFVNEAILQILIHELIHVRQIKYLFEKKDYDIEYEILRSSNTSYFIDNDFQLPYLEEYFGTSVKKYYGKDFRTLKKQVDKLDDMYNRSDSFYDNDPSEINAEYESFKEIIYLNEYINPALNEDWKDLLFLQTEAHYTCRKSRVICPFERFIRKRNRILTLDSFDFDKYDYFSLPLDKRLSYGLPISRIEYKEMEEYIKSIHL